jgi:catechol 2,3-dioxygenase-like lactoylglutathione lyase family enzyme
MKNNVVDSIKGINDASIKHVDLKFEAVVIPVSDVDRAKEFYARLGWRLDADFPFDNGFRVVQFTPPGSGGSIGSAEAFRPPACISPPWWPCRRSSSPPSWFLC